MCACLCAVGALSCMNVWSFPCTYLHGACRCTCVSQVEHIFQVARIDRVDQDVIDVHSSDGCFFHCCNKRNKLDFFLIRLLRRYWYLPAWFFLPRINRLAKSWEWMGSSVHVYEHEGECACLSTSWSCLRVRPSERHNEHERATSMTWMYPNPTAKWYKHAVNTLQS